MQCDLDVTKVKNNSFLYKDEKGKVISVTKEEILKETNQEISDLKIKNEQLECEIRNLKDVVKANEEKMAKFLKVIGGLK